jgi:hypothetical protein
LKRLLNVTLAAIFALSISALLLANEDPFARKFVCVCIGLCHHFPSAFYKIIYDLSVGSLITLFFYFLVVRLPEYERRQRLKRSLKRHYDDFKEDSIEIMLAVTDGSYCADIPTILMDQDKFKNYFTARVTTSDQDRWTDFQNNLDEYNLRRLLTCMEIFREELMFVLNNTDVSKDQPFEFLKRLSAIIYSMKTVTLGYEETKPFERFLWDVFAGFDLITGYRKEDIIKNMIAAI